MSNLQDGGSVFPSEGGKRFVHGDGVCNSLSSSGLSVRDYFAAKAMQGMISSDCTVDIDGDYIFQKRAQTAYLIADAMIKAREEQ